MKKMIAYISLLAVGFLLLPKTLWHECDHASHHSELLSGDHASVEEQDCAVCAMDFIPADLPDIAFRYSANNWLTHEQISFVQAVQANHLYIPGSRGSPLYFS